MPQCNQKAASTRSHANCLMLHSWLNWRAKIWTQIHLILEGCALSTSLNISLIPKDRPTNLVLGPATSKMKLSLRTPNTSCLGHIPSLCALHPDRKGKENLTPINSYQPSVEASWTAWQVCHFTLTPSGGLMLLSALNPVSHGLFFYPLYWNIFRDPWSSFNQHQMSFLSPVAWETPFFLRINLIIVFTSTRKSTVSCR